MPTTEGPSEPAADRNGIELRLATIDVLMDVLEWRLPEARWPHVAGVVQSVESALSAGDLRQLEVAIVDLELAGPIRITRVGATPQEPAPAKVRDRVNRMVHSLTGAAQEQQPGGERDRPRDQR